MTRAPDQPRRAPRAFLVAAVAYVAWLIVLGAVAVWHRIG